MSQIKAILNKIRNKAPSWGWAFYFLFTGIIAVLVSAVVYQTISNNYLTWINWLVNDASLTEILFFALLFFLLIYKPYYFFRASFIFFKETLTASNAGR